jgi:hypothetical protein
MLKTVPWAEIAVEDMIYLSEKRKPAKAGVVEDKN